MNEPFKFSKTVPIYIDTKSGEVTRKQITEEEFRDLIGHSTPRVLDVWKYAPSIFPQNAGNTTRPVR